MECNKYITIESSFCVKLSDYKVQLRKAVIKCTAA